MNNIVYILSQGHSGSTLLDMLIGSHSKAFSIGERIVKNLGLETNRPCTCGAETLSQCSFWSQVDNYLENFNHNLNQLQIEAARSETFQSHNSHYYNAISSISKADALIDSAKSINRLRKLSDCTVFNLKVIFLERSPFGVVASQHRRKGGWLYQTIMHQINSTAKRHYAKYHDHLYVKYEDLTKDPEQHLQLIMQYIGLEFEATQINWTDTEFHLLGGSRLRFRPNVKIQPDERWRSELTLFQKIIIYAFNNPMVDSLMISIFGIYRFFKSKLI